MKYLRKQSTIEAEQFLGQEIAGIRVIKNEIIYSLDKKHFYPSNVDAKNWLSVEKVKGADGDKYESYAFAFYEFKSHPEREELNTNNKHLVDLYCEIFSLKQPSVIAYVDNQKVNYGDWIVREEVGVRIYTDELFRQVFYSKEDPKGGTLDYAIEILVEEKPLNKLIHKAVEELSELTTKLMQFVNKPFEKNLDIEEEIVDVKINLKILEHFFPVSEELVEKKVRKLYQTEDYRGYAEGKRCCGRCDGHNDICVSDRFCDAHNVQGCEECFGKR